MVGKNIQCSGAVILQHSKLGDRVSIHVNTDCVIRLLGKSGDTRESIMFYSGMLQTDNMIFLYSVATIFEDYFGISQNVIFSSNTASSY